MTSDFLFKPRDFRQINVWKNVSDAEWNNPRWQLHNSIRTTRQLQEVIQLTSQQAMSIENTINQLKSEGKDPMRITPYYATLMNKNPFDPVYEGIREKRNWIDPVFWQSVPTPANLMFPDAGPEGAMAEGSRSYGAAYQRYPNRVALLVAQNTSCAAYCVHCQRAKSLDAHALINMDEINRGLFYIAQNHNINEVLVTGGDPLMIKAGILKYILEELGRIPHLRSIRMATRVPVVLPMAITDDLLIMIKESVKRLSKGPEKYVYFMTHINHYREITGQLANAVRKIQDAGFTVRNQTVLLNHVNDSFYILAETFRRMFWAGVHPYYLLQCHKEKGILHFITPIQVGKIYMKHLQGWISGITVPRYAANIEGGGGKVLLMPSGHDTLNLKENIESKISESYATISTWDQRTIFRYEALGRASRKEFAEAMNVMESFIMTPHVFQPKLILVDANGKHLETTFRSRLPGFERSRKSTLLNYQQERNGLPLTNPATITTHLDEQFSKSRFSGRKKR